VTAVHNLRLLLGGYHWHEVRV